VAEGPSEVTRQRYRQQVCRFEKFLARISGFTLADVYAVGAWQALTIWVLLYMQVGYDTGLLGPGDAANLLCGIKWMFIREVMTASYAALDIESALRIPWRSYQHWKKVEPSEFRLPLPHQVVLGMAGGALALKDLPMVLFLLLSFRCLLRPNEALGLTWAHVRCRHRPGIVCIHNPKVKSPLVQHVLIECPLLLRLCQVLKASATPADRVFPFDEWGLHTRWLRLLRMLHLNKDLLLGVSTTEKGYSPGGLRAGGATQDFLQFQNLGRLQWRGRWRVASTLEHYIQLGVYYLAMQDWPDTIQAKVDRHAAHVLSFLLALKEGTGPTRPP
jgi:hypothetical protein